MVTNLLVSRFIVAQAIRVPPVGRKFGACKADKHRNENHFYSVDREKPVKITGKLCKNFRFLRRFQAYCETLPVGG
jgi:hypothetical protein